MAKMGVFTSIGVLFLILVLGGTAMAKEGDYPFCMDQCLKSGGKTWEQCHALCQILA